MPSLLRSEFLRWSNPVTYASGPLRVFSSPTLLVNENHCSREPSLGSRGTRYHHELEASLKLTIDGRTRPLRNWEWATTHSQYVGACQRQGRHRQHVNRADPISALSYLLLMCLPESCILPPLALRAPIYFQTFEGRPLQRRIAEIPKAFGQGRRGKFTSCWEGLLRLATCGLEYSWYAEAGAFSGFQPKKTGIAPAFE